VRISVIGDEKRVKERSASFSPTKSRIGQLGQIGSDWVSIGLRLDQLGFVLGFVSFFFLSFVSFSSSQRFPKRNPISTQINPIQALNFRTVPIQTQFSGFVWVSSLRSARYSQSKPNLIPIDF
jgi:hypothetical protein